ncbi:ATPase, partial [Streptomyces sp. UNOC14_S4]|nr:ATPase [Streptomyces sp. UNOC14_S4]
IAELRSAQLPVGGVVINMVRPEVLDETDVEVAANGSRAAVARTLSHALDRTGFGGTRHPGLAERLVDPLVAQAREHTERLALERRGHREISGLGLPTYELELLGDGVDLAGLYRMARELRKQGV